MSTNEIDLKRANDLCYDIQFKRTQLKRQPSYSLNKEYIRHSIARDIAQLNSLKRSLGKRKVEVRPIPKTGPKIVEIKRRVK